ADVAEESQAVAFTEAFDDGGALCPRRLPGDHRGAVVANRAVQRHRKDLRVRDGAREDKRAATFRQPSEPRQDPSVALVLEPELLDVVAREVLELREAAELSVGHRAGPLDVKPLGGDVREDATPLEGPDRLLAERVWADELLLEVAPEGRALLVVGTP